MGTDTGKLEDDFAVELGDVPAPPEGMTYSVVDGERKLVENQTLPSIGERPSKSASREDWVEYAVSLGADRNHIENDIEYIVDATPGSVKVDESPALTVAEIKELAERLGG